MDMINKPGHYKGKFGMEAIEVVKNFIWDLTAIQGFYYGNILKYLLRFQKKNGVEDLKKARKNLDWLIEDCEATHKSITPFNTVEPKFYKEVQNEQRTKKQN